MVRPNKLIIVYYLLTYYNHTMMP